MSKFAFPRRSFLHAAGVSLLWAALPALPQAAELSRVIDTIKPSVVGVGSFLKTRAPAVTFVGTGFAVADGLSVITNAHVVNGILNRAADQTTVSEKETLGIVVGRGENAVFRSATLVALDAEHDLAHLRISGAPLPALEIGDSGKVVEGQNVAFTGFPLGMVLGLHHVTHRAMISAVTPIIIPVQNSRRLDSKSVVQLRRSPFTIFQLDGTAYPGNSGSPLYDAQTGTVVGVINMVLVKGLKENAIASPSGISYAIPSNYVTELLRRPPEAAKPPEDAR